MDGFDGDWKKSALQGELAEHREAMEMVESGGEVAEWEAMEMVESGVHTRRNRSGHSCHRSQNRREKFGCRVQEFGDLASDLDLRLSISFFSYKYR